MPAPTRRQAQQYRFPPPEESDDTDSDLDVTRPTTRPGDGDHGDTIGDDESGLDDDDLEDEDALASPNEHDTDLPNLEPPPSYLREISTLASWTVSSSKPGCSIPQLRHPSTALFWQSDGPQPHYLNIHFFKLVRIAGLRLYLDFEQDESYTPTRIIFLAGSGLNDLQEWGEMKLESPRGWVWADFSGVGDPDSDDEDEDYEEDYEEEANSPETQRTIHTPPSLAGAGARAGAIDASSDSENNAPRPPLTHIISDDTMQLDLPPHHRHHSPTMPPLPLTTTHHPFDPLFPNAAPPTPPAHPRRRRRTPKIPILRAHLVQIKILENHQNGKDTHLRGLQIFARNDEEQTRSPARGVRPATATATKMVMDAGTHSQNAGLARRERSVREERFDLGGASRSAWDVEPSFR